jgi:hypothetical protein
MNSGLISNAMTVPTSRNKRRHSALRVTRNLSALPGVLNPAVVVVPIIITFSILGFIG